jgi:hypothetical protein
MTDFARVGVGAGEMHSRALGGAPMCISPGDQAIELREMHSRALCGALVCISPEVISRGRP